MEKYSEYLKKKLQEHNKNKIAIYGAGEYAMYLCGYLEICGMKDLISYFVVTNKENNVNEANGISVVSFDEIKMELNDKLILIAMKQSDAQQVQTQLLTLNIQFTEIITKEKKDYFFQEIINECKKKTIEKNKVFICCYDGLGYKCNCKYIAEKLKNTNENMQVVWAVSLGSDYDFPSWVKKVYVNTKEYYEELYTSKFYIVNVDRDVKVQKREGQYYINTWHGYGPLKKVNTFLNTWDEKEKKEFKDYTNDFDLFLTGSSFYTEIYRKDFLYEGDVLECGAPRNDVFYGENNVLKEKVYSYFDIPREKKILLYAPTFRCDKERTFELYDLNMDKVLESLMKRFGGEYVLMYRFHYHLLQMNQCNTYKEIGYNATFYDDTQELLVAADVVITDYSSLMWDFSLQRKPVFLYQNDASEYEDERGFYAPVEEWPYPKAHTQEEMVKTILEFDQEKYIRELNAFLEKYGSCDDGHASERVVELIREKMKE